MSMIAAPLRGQELSNLAGAFADLHLGVRPAGMGDAYTALSADGNAVLFNPAAASFVNYAALTATTTRILQLVPATFLGLHYPVGSTSWLAGVQQIGDNLLRETTIAVAASTPMPRLLPRPFGTVAALRRMALSTTLRFRLVSFGNNDDGGNNRVTGGGRGYAVDFGYYYQFDGLRFGASLQDAFGHFRWDSSTRGHYTQNLPRRLRLGMAYVESRLRLALDYQPGLYRDLNDRVYAGLETNVVRWLVLRGGLAQNIGGQFENKIMTLGIGVYSLSWQRYRLAVQGSYRTGELDTAYRFAIDLFWPGARD